MSWFGGYWDRVARLPATRVCRRGNRQRDEKEFVELEWVKGFQLGDLPCSPLIHGELVGAKRNLFIFSIVRVGVCMCVLDEVLVEEAAAVESLKSSCGRRLWRFITGRRTGQIVHSRGSFLIEPGTLLPSHHVNTPPAIKIKYYINK